MRLNNQYSTELTNETPSSESSCQEPRQGKLAKASVCQWRLHVERRRRRQRQFTDSSTPTTAASNSGTVTSVQQQSTARPASTTASSGDAAKTPRRTGGDDGIPPAPGDEHSRIVAQRRQDPDSLKKFLNSSEVDPDSSNQHGVDPQLIQLFPNSSA